MGLSLIGRQDRLTMSGAFACGALVMSAARHPMRLDLATRSSAQANPKLLHRLRQALRSRHYSRRTEQTYGHWVQAKEQGRHHIDESLVQKAVRDAVSGSRIDEAGHLPYVPAFLCDSPARRRLRYPNGPGASATQGRERGDDLYPCPRPGTVRDAKPHGRAVR